MKLAALLALLLAPSFALAHITPGTWKGKTAEGKECSMHAGPTYFEGGARHPLNERIAITVDGKEYKVGHPPVLDFAQPKAFFNHDVFQGLLPTGTGAQAIEIEMAHEEGREGPVSFTYVDHAWKSDTRTSYKCAGLEHQK